MTSCHIYVNAVFYYELIDHHWLHGNALHVLIHGVIVSTGDIHKGTLLRNT